MPLFSKKITPTTITTNIEKATTQQDLDWALVYEICQVVNNSELGAKEARKLLQKKMLTPVPKTQVISLEILNSLSENCREKMRDQLCAKTFGEDLDKLAREATDDEVHSRLLQCLQHWVVVYGQDPAAGALCRVHEFLVHGQTQAPAQRTGLFGSQMHMIQQQHQQQRQHPQLPTGPAKPADILADVELAKNNAQLFSQTLSFTDPTQEDITKNELIQEFYSKCKMFQRVISDHLQACDDPDLVSALILANGELINAFKAYDDMLEHGAINVATTNSRSVNVRGTNEPLISLDSNQQASSSSSSSNGNGKQPEQMTSAPAATSSSTANIDPFDPFADVPEASSQQSGSPIDTAKAS
ncbi:hypothetical protein BC940DRAFT_108519 [Gongronella butleri]|nr:hypothetical protein BC940DRAFT_108519 [Gongronella butleri]